jgi:hypothetical protein
MSMEKVREMRSRLRWANVMLSELSQHRYEHQTHKYRRCICPGCKREWPVLIYAEYASCEDCHSRQGSYQICLMEVQAYIETEDDGTKYPKGEARCIVAFHTGRWVMGWWAQPTYSYDVLDDWDDEYTPQPMPVAGWDHLTGEEYRL